MGAGSARPSEVFSRARPRPRLAVFGDIALDIIVIRLEAVARDSDARARITPSAGGSAANFATWAARSGAAVAFFGQAGDDLVGRQLRGDLAREGVAVDPPNGNLRLDPSTPTGIIIVDVEAGGAGRRVATEGGVARTMITDRGANLTVPPDLVTPEALERCDWLHLTGYSFFEPGPRAAALAALGECRRQGRPYSVDPSSFRLLGDYGPARFLDEVSGAAALFPNRDEAAILTGHDSPARAAAELARRFPVVAVKLGREGSLVAVGGRLEAVPAIRPSRPVMDPTGAGDAFAAGFLCRYATASRSTEAGGLHSRSRSALPVAALAARAGAELAALAIQTIGGRGVLRPR